MLPFHILWLSLTNALGVMGVFHIGMSSRGRGIVALMWPFKPSHSIRCNGSLTVSIAWFKLKEDAKPENVKEWQRLAQGMVSTESSLVSSYEHAMLMVCNAGVSREADDTTRTDMLTE